MPAPPYQPKLARIRLHPIKSLDPLEVTEARIGPNGGLEFDRVWALHSSDSQLINGKRTPAVHFIRAEYSPDLSAVTLSVPRDRRALPAATFAFPGDTEGAALWFSRHFELPVIVRYAREGFPDDRLASGPTIVSTASLESVCSWFPGMTVDEARLRFRTTLEIGVDRFATTHEVDRFAITHEVDRFAITHEVDRSAVTNENDRFAVTQDVIPAFWEDQLFGAEENYPRRFRIGQVAFEGSNPCARCPVPPRHPETAEEIPAFQKHFSAMRRSTLPAWSPAARFDHYYRLATNTRVPSTECGKLLRAGDPVELL